MLTILSLAAFAAAPPPPVVNGTQVPEGKWLDTAGVYLRNQVSCTGTLIAPNLVITAGHCNEGITKVILGTNDYERGGEVINVSRAIEYPNSQRNYDVTILVLERDSTIPPRTIAQGCILDEYLHDGATVTIVGYGATDYRGYRYDSKLMEADTTVDDADCSDTRQGCQSSVSPGGELGAGATDDVDSCYGDSGGPLYLPTPYGDFLVGVTSRSYSTVPYDEPCHFGGIYVRPDAIIDWIEDETGVELDEAACNSAPEAEDVYWEVPRKRRDTIQLGAHDPDGDNVSYFVALDPDMGDVDLSPEGELTYKAPRDRGLVGETAVILVEAVDDAEQPLATDFRVYVTIGEGGCGCATGPAQMGWAWVGGLLGLAGLRRRR